jgi:hypothetical protein
MYTKEEIVAKVQEIAEGMDRKVETIEQLKASVLVDRGRLEELKNLHNMIVVKEQELAKKKEKKKPAPKNRRVKK